MEHINIRILRDCLNVSFETMPLPVRRMQTVHRMQCSRRFRFGAWRKVQHRCRQTARRGSWKWSDCWTLRCFRTHSTLENWTLVESRCTLDYLSTPRQKNYSCDKKQSLSNGRDGAQNVCTQMLPTQCNRRSTIHAVYKTLFWLWEGGMSVCWDTRWGSTWLRQ